MDTRNSRKMWGGSVPVLANKAGGAETAAASQSTQPHVAQPPLRERPLTEQDIVGLKYFDELLPLFQRLRDDGCQRDKAGNRELHYDQYCLLVLLYLFNPICSSLRAVQQASKLKNVQKKGSSEVLRGCVARSGHAGLYWSCV